MRLLLPMLYWISLANSVTYRHLFTSQSGLSDILRLFFFCAFHHQFWAFISINHIPFILRHLAMEDNPHTCTRFPTKGSPPLSRRSQILNRMLQRLWLLLVCKSAGTSMLCLLTFHIIYRGFLNVNLGSGRDWPYIRNLSPGEFSDSLLNAAGPEGLTAWAWGLINQP